MKNELEFTTEWNGTEFTFDLYFDLDGNNVDEDTLTVMYNEVDVTHIIDNNLWMYCLYYAEGYARSKADEKYQGEYD